MRENKEQCSIYDDKIISGHVFFFTLCSFSFIAGTEMALAVQVRKPD